MKKHPYSALLYSLCYYGFVFCGIIALAGRLPWWAHHPLAQVVSRASLFTAFGILFTVPLVALLTVGIDGRREGRRALWHLPVLAVLIVAMVLGMLAQR